MKYKYTTFGKRLVGGIIDYIILFFVFMIAVNYLEILITKNSAGLVWGWLVFIVMIYGWGVPFMFFDYMAVPFLEYICTMVPFAIIFLLEALYYSDILPIRGFGRFITKTQVLNADGTKPSRRKLFARGCLKTISRYFYGLPALTMTFTKQEQALHDMLVGTVVVDRKRFWGKE